MIDGYIARKVNAVSTLGAALDSAADAVFIGILMIVLLPVMKIPPWIWIYIAVIAAVRIVSIVIGYVKYRQIAMLHTYANKAAGLILFAVPILYSSIDISILGGIVCTAALLSAAEEMLIQIRSKELNRDIRGIFEKKKSFHA
jgi:CDP-diacylglycerol--glycerol-3-phosphate 3-phosphatidyltransferase